jgi:hypothetical protein
VYNTPYYGNNETNNINSRMLLPTAEKTYVSP